MADLVMYLIETAANTQRDLGRLFAQIEASRAENAQGRAAIHKRIEDVRSHVTLRLDKLEKGNRKGNHVLWLSYLPLLLQVAAIGGLIIAGLILHLSADEWKALLFKGRL